MTSIFVKVNVPPRLEYIVISEMPLSKWAKTAAGKKFITILDDITISNPIKEIETESVGIRTIINEFSGESYFGDGMNI